MRFDTRLSHLTLSGDSFLPVVYNVYMNLHLLLLAIIEGATEFLPVSSTAHLIIASHLLTIDLTSEYIKFYLLFIQFGALLAGTIMYFGKIVTNRQLFINLFLSFLPSAVVGFAFYKLFKHLLEGNFALMSFMLFIGGVIFMYLEKFYIPKLQLTVGEGRDELTTSEALCVGLAQAVAIVPGVSRSGATIVVGVLLGIKKSAILEYTFMLALPTLGAAVIYDAYKSRAFLLWSSIGELFIGASVALVSAMLTLWLVRRYLPRLSLWWFGIYRLALAALIIIFLY